MSDNGRKSEVEAAQLGERLESLYFDFLKWFYESPNRERASPIAVELERELSSHPEHEGSIRADEVRSLLAEFRGAYAEAARSREAEIRKIHQLHLTAVNTPQWEYIARCYDHGDVSDRLDILASLYDKMGDLSRAVEVLRESEQYCRSHGIDFESDDLLQELERALKRKRSTAGVKKRPSQPQRLDDAIRAVYAVHHATFDDIMVSARSARLFADEVNHRLTEPERVGTLDVKRRLLTLSRRRKSSGGLTRHKP